MPIDPEPQWPPRIDGQREIVGEIVDSGVWSAFGSRIEGGIMWPAPRNTAFLRERRFAGWFTAAIEQLIEQPDTARQLFGHL